MKLSMYKKENYSKEKVDKSCGTRIRDTFIWDKVWKNL